LTSSRSLAVSVYYTIDPAHAVFGIHQRFAIFVSALGRLGDVDVLLFAPHDAEIDEPARLVREQLLSEQTGANVHLELCPRRDDRGRSRIHRHGSAALSLYSQPRRWPVCGPEQLAALDARLAERPDRVFAIGLDSMAPIMSLGATSVPIFLDINDIEHKWLWRELGQEAWRPGKALRYLQLPSLLLGERRATRLAQRSFVCSEQDAAYLRRLGYPRIEAIPNSVAIPPLTPLPEAPNFLFLGTLRYAPNQRAVAYLLAEVWPLIRSRVPSATLTIAGAGPEEVPEFPSQNGTQGVTFTGFVDDLEPVYAESRVVLAPILSGGGTRVKILEAAAHGRPAVSTTIGAEGLEMVPGHEILIEDDPRDFADACIELAGDMDRCQHIGSAARERTEALYHSERIIERLTQLFLTTESL